MKMYSVRYWSTKGIEELDFTPTDCGKYATHERGYCRRCEKIGRDVFPNFLAAQAAARKKRDAKVASMLKSIEKIKAMKFDLPPTPTERSGA